MRIAIALCLAAFTLHARGAGVPKIENNFATTNVSTTLTNIVKSLATNAANGTQVWTNSAGVIRPVETVASTNILFQPTAADGVTPYTLDTSVPHTSGSVLVVNNNGSNQMQVLPNGSMMLGDYTMGYWGFPFSGSFIYVGNSNAGQNNFEMAFEVVDADGNNDSEADIYGDIGYSEIYLSNKYRNGTDVALYGYIDLHTSIVDDTLYMKMGAGGTNLMELNPKSSVSSVAYLLNTSKYHTSGDLMEVANNSTNKFTVDYAGVVTAANIITPTNPPVVGQVLTATSTAGASKWDYVNQVGTNVATGSNANFNLPYSRFTVATAFLWTSPANVDTTLTRLQVTDVAVTNSTAAAILATFNGTVRVTGTPYVTNVTYFHWRADPWMTNCSCEPVF